MTEHPEAMLIRTSSFFPLPSFLALSVSLHSSLTSLDDSRSSQIIASLSGVFSLLPAPPLLAPFLSLSPAPSFHVSSLPPVFSDLPSLDPSLNPQATDQPSARREKKGRREGGGWEDGRKDGEGDGTAASYEDGRRSHTNMQR